MIYNPKSLSKSENLNKLEIGNVLHDGINYMVYESTNSVIKMYKGDVSQLDKLMQILEQETLLCQQHTLFIAPLKYQIVNNDRVYVQYNKQSQLGGYIKQKHIDFQEQQKQDQELYDQLVDDNYQIQIQVTFSDERLRVIIIETLFYFYELESQGIVLHNIKMNNVFIQDEIAILFQDLINRSSYHELTLEEYLLDIPKQNSKSNPQSSAQSIQQLTIIFVSLATMTDLDDVEQIEEYVSTISHHSVEIIDLLKIMPTFDFYYQIFQCPQYISLINMMDQQTIKDIHTQFYIQPKLNYLNAFQRIEAKRLKTADFWNQKYYRNLNPFIPQNISFQIKSIKTIKTLDIITALEIIDQTIYGVTYNGNLIDLDTNQIILKVSKGTLHCLKYFNKKICMAGEDKLVYVKDTCQLNKHQYGIYSMNKTIKYLLTGDNGGVIIIWNHEFNFERIMQVHESRVNDIKLKSSQQFYTCSEDKTVKLWDVHFKQKEQIAVHAKKLHYWDNQLFVLGDSLTIYEHPKVIYKQTVKCSSVQQLSSCQLLIVSSTNLVVFNILTRQIEKEQKLHMDRISDIKLAQNSQIITVGFDKQMKIITI